MNSDHIRKVIDSLCESEHDTTHLNALELRLSHEKEYLRKAETPREVATRKVWITQIEKEIADEKAFLGISDQSQPEMTDDELLAELGLGDDLPQKGTNEL